MTTHADRSAKTSSRLRRRTATLVLGFGLTAAGCTAPTASDIASMTSAPAVKAPLPPPVVIQPRYGTSRLARSENAVARPELDRGRLDPERRLANLSLFFALTPEQRAARDALAASQLDPKSPSYHQWLTPETYRTAFGAPDAVLARASAWLAEQGLEVHRTSPLGTRVSFSGKVKDLEAAFQTEMHRYEVAGVMHYAMATAPALPDDLAKVVLGLHNSHDFFPRPASRRINQHAFERREPLGAKYTINFPGGPDGGFQVLGPPDWAAAYDVAKLYSPGISGKDLDGTGVTIGIVGTAAIAQSDVDAFRATFNLPQKNVTMTLVPDTGPASGGQYGSGVEAILDVEWSGGIAKGATVDYVFVGEDDPNVDDGTFYLIEQNLTPLMSESYGGCEAGVLPTDADVSEENGTAANLMGITYMAAAGDDGAADCVEEGLSGLYVDMPGSFPGVTSVGGTQFPSPAWNAAGDLESYPTLEQVWNESNDPYSYYMGYPVGVGAGGGGISAVFQRPLWQTAAPACQPNGSLPVPSTTPMRQVPDIAVSAASSTPGYFIECTFDQTTQDCSAKGGMPFGTPIGGTSASSPSFTGVIAILNQAVGERLGNINPVLYQLQAASLADPPFHDITSGSNEIACGAAGAGDAGDPDGGIWPDAGCGEGGLYGYAAVPGYDCASGVGSVDGFNLVSAWLGAVKTSTTIVPAPTTTKEGDDVTLTATVAVDGASTRTVTGNVTFTFESFTENGTLDLSWELGAVALGSGTTTGGTAAWTGPIPPGLARPGHQFVDVVAVYGGDEYHLSSTSAPAQIDFAAFTFAIVPATLSLEPFGTQTFTTTGGVPPVRWFIDVDTTASYSADGYQASTLGETDGGFVAGPMSGYVEISALDSYGAEALADITVGLPSGTAPWDMDAGVDAAASHDAGKIFKAPDAGKDAGLIVFPIPDAARPHEAAAVDAHHEDATDDDMEPATGGCSCDVASPEGAFGGAPSLLFAAGFLVRRRRQRR